jgi:hypothetical protein
MIPKIMIAIISIMIVMAMVRIRPEAGINSKLQLLDHGLTPPVSFAALTLQ